MARGRGDGGRGIDGNGAEPLLRVRGLRKSYGAIEVLRGVDLDVPAGSTVAVIGPNGAGKTTLFRTLTGEVGANAGTIRYAGAAMDSVPAWRRVRGGMGRTFQTARVFARMTVADNMALAIEARSRAEAGGGAAWWRTRPSPAVAAECAERLAHVGLRDRDAALAGTLSHGDKKRLELALALALRPRLLMLDEPTAGMSPGDRIAAVQLIRRIKAETGLTLLLTEHDMGVVFDLASHVVVLAGGAVLAAGAPEAVRRDPGVRAAYLGHGHA